MDNRGASLYATVLGALDNSKKNQIIRFDENSSKKDGFSSQSNQIEATNSQDSFR